ncbi:MAG: hypothetical protein GQ526_09310 [Ardenticatenales bacterium]|nr:hypothetical protein [Ardenticatenales bacterium]
MKMQQGSGLIERYTAAVGRLLPRRIRGDVEAELRSSLSDTLEDRSEMLERPADEEMVAEILVQMGHPEQVAANYQPRRYLVGPRLYPAFIRVLTILLAVLGAVHLVGLAVALVGAGQEALEIAAETMGGFIASFFGALGMTVLIFGILDRVVPTEPERSTQSWNPRNLAAVDSQTSVGMIQGALDIVFAAGFMVVFNLFPDKVGIGLMRDLEWHWIPVLTTAFGSYLLALNVRWVLGMVHGVWLLRQGEWRTWNRWAALGLHLFSITILYAMIVGQPVIALPPYWEAEFLAAIKGIGFGRAQGLLASAQDYLLGLIILTIWIDMAKQVVALAKAGAFPLTWRLNFPQDKPGSPPR